MYIKNYILAIFMILVLSLMSGCAQDFYFVSELDVAKICGAEEDSITRTVSGGQIYYTFLSGERIILNQGPQWSEDGLQIILETSENVTEYSYPGEKSVIFDNENARRMLIKYQGYALGIDSNVVDCRNDEHLIEIGRIFTGETD